MRSFSTIKINKNSAILHQRSNYKLKILNSTKYLKKMMDPIKVTENYRGFDTVTIFAEIKNTWC